jgi:hypothetical protein
MEFLCSNYGFASFELGYLLVRCAHVFLILFLVRKGFVL